MPPLRVATRGSALARWQAERVIELLGVEAEYVIVSTRGDERRDVPIHAMGGTGVFVKEVEQTVLDGRAEVAVHSAKDLPSEPSPELVLAALPERGHPRDALGGRPLAEIPTGGRVGTGSVRRRAQLAGLRPDLGFGQLRGNIPTRLEKADGFDAVVLAAAALDRLGLADRIAERVDPSVVLPQVAQGALAAECRFDDDGTRELLAGIDDDGVRAAVTAERSYLAELGGGCNLPCGALAETRHEGSLRLDALLGSLDGRISLRARVEGHDPVAVGVEAARRLVDEEGGRLVLDDELVGGGGEEAEALGAAGVQFEVVPGITSAIGAPAYAGIPVTHRGTSTHFTVVTGHEDPAKESADVDWEALAKAGGTLVILMGAGRVADIAARLVAGGRPPETPVAAVRNGTRADQRTVRATLATIADAGVRAPAAIVVGEVAGLDLAWFESRPLFGRSVVVTRAREQASALRRRLEGLGAEVIELPAIAIEPLAFDVPDLDPYRWLVFTSANGVAAFFDRGVASAGLDARHLAGVRLAAIGPGTAAALAERGLRADLLPERFVAESLLEAFPAPAAAGERVLLARAEKARDVLPAGLSERGYAVDVLAVYRTVAATPDPDVLERVRRGEVDALTFTSSSTVTNLCDLLGDVPSPQPLVASIGPVTSTTALA